MTYVDGRRSSAVKRAAWTALLLCVTISAAAAEDQYNDQPAKAAAGAKTTNGQPPNVQYAPGQYPTYKPTATPPANGQYDYPKPPAPPKYPYSQKYPNAQFPPGQYRGSEQDQQACIGDVFRLCSQAIPDVSRIIACLQTNKRSLSPSCKAVFGRGHRGGKKGGGK